MHNRFSFESLRCAWILVAVVAVGCATTPPDDTETLRMSAQDGAEAVQYPPPGTIWRLEQHELEALGPLVPAPDPPPAPPRRPAADRDIGYVLVPSIVYYGSRFGFGWERAPYWPHYGYTPFRPYFYDPWYPWRR